jgi:hypothetical protein
MTSAFSASSASLAPEESNPELVDLLHHQHLKTIKRRKQ